MYTVEYTKNARRDLKKFDIKTSQRIINKVFFYSQQKDPLSFAKKLTNSQIGDYRFRIGEYRVVFDVDKNGTLQLLMILRIKHRKDVYGL